MITVEVKKRSYHRILRPVQKLTSDDKYSVC